MKVPAKLVVVNDVCPCGSKEDLARNLATPLFYGDELWMNWRSLSRY